VTTTQHPPAGGQPHALSASRRLAYGIAAPALYCLVRALWASCRIRVVHVGHGRGEPSPDRLILPCFWHQQLLLCTFHLQDLVRHGFRLGWLISPSRDGELAARVARHWPIRVIRGSATRTGLKAIRGLHRVMVGDRVSPVMLPDGPHGPPRRFKPGAIMLAQLTSAALVPMAAAVDRGWHLGSWDRMMIPRPFSRIVIVRGEPREIPRDLPSHRLEDERRAMEKALDSLESTAREHLGARRD
jgi:lysophospholipid acyltransferase (LPLAT)-like uncharacterized protein